MKAEVVTTMAPISDADSRAQLVAERVGRLLCTTVAADGLRCGKDWPTCIGALRCIETGGCFWRRWHGVPADKMAVKTVTE